MLRLHQDPELCFPPVENNWNSLHILATIKTKNIKIATIYLYLLVLVKELYEIILIQLQLLVTQKLYLSNHQ